MTDKLKPCPFCGESPDIGNAVYDGRKAGAYYIACTSTCEVHPELNDTYDSPNEAIKAWNTRANDWQPIDTAPKDGKVFVGFNDSKSPKYFVCIWDDYSPESQAGHEYRLGVGRRGDFYSFWEFEFRSNMLKVYPTHWQPLPTPPMEKDNEK